ncbi:MAG: TolC family protein [Campylobacterota bacterium]
MKKLYLLSSLLCSALLGSEEFLSQEKLETLKLQEQKAQYDADFLKKSWINPVMLSYDKTHNDTLDETTTTTSVSIDQPVFQSGGIYFSIKYAGSVRDSSIKQVEAQKRELVAQAVDLLYEYQKTQKQIQKLQLLIKNSEIEIERKKEQYMAGLVDSSDLDRALLEKNENSINLLEARQSLAQIENNFAKISDLEIKTAKAPKLSVVSEQNYVENNIDLLAQNSELRGKNYQRYMTASKYLPQVSLTARYSDSDNRGPMQPSSQETYGVKVSLPLNLNSYDDIQRDRVEYLKSAVELNDTKRTLKHEYQNIMSQVEFIDKKIQLSKEDAKMYENLVAQTKDQVFIGNQTEYDLQTMQNSMQIKQLDQSIYTIDKNRLLFELYIKTYES